MATKTKAYFKKAKEYEGKIESLENDNKKKSRIIRNLTPAKSMDEIKPTPEKDSLFSYIDNKVQDSIGHTATWSSNQLKWHKLRMRIKKAKTFPFVGCSNIRMPTAETKIRKVKAALIKAVFGIKPLVQAIPSPSGNLQVAMKIEKFLDHLISNVINLRNKAIIATDQELEKGFYLFKPYWRTEITTRNEELSLEDLSIEEAFQLYSMNTTPEMVVQMIMQKIEPDMSAHVIEDNEKAISKAVSEILEGKTKIKIKLRDVLYNAPDVALVDPERCYVPTDSGFDPQTCQCLIHEFFMPLNQVKANVELKNWDKSAVDEINAYKHDDVKKLTEVEKDLKEGIERIANPSKLVKIWEFYGWYDLNGDGVDEKVVITTAPEFKKVLRKISLPFDNGKFPFVKTYYELRDDRWFAHRGIPELIEDIIKEIDIQHMQKLDQQTIRNAPMFMYRAGMVNPNLVQFMPNQGIPVNGMQPLTDTLQIVDNHNPNVEFSYEREQMLLESKLEELLGQVDFSLQSMINKREPRTLGEVQLQQQNMQSVFSLDVDMHISGYSELFSMIWDLWCQYGDDQVEFAYFGENGFEPIKLSREEIQGKYKIVVRGNDQNTNPQVRMMKAQQILAATTNPLYLQTGVIGPIQIANGLKRFYQELDVQNWEEFINLQPMPTPPPASQLVQPGFADLADGEKAQILSQLGIKPDMQGRMLSKQQELMENAPKPTGK